MYIYLSKKIAIPNGVQLNCISWNPQHGWITCGGQNGLLKVLKMETTPSSNNPNNGQPPLTGIAAPTTLTMNQTLEGHKDGVTVLAWNKVYRKLTTSDTQGLIIVWMLQKGVWVEEMINNRNKSVVKDMKWTHDGGKICIVYADGAVICGSVDGNRLWGKDLPHELALVSWSPDGKHILFLTDEGELHLYDNTGSKHANVVLFPDENTTSSIISIDWYSGSEGYVSPNAPALAIAFRSGRIQIGRGQYDEDPTLIDANMMIKKCQWNYNGSVLAVAGIQTLRNAAGNTNDINVLAFYDPFGTLLKSIKIPGKTIESVSWEGMGLRLCMAVDSHIYFANVRPSYHWGYFGKTVVYGYTKPECDEMCIVFWDTCSGERYNKYLKGFIAIAAAGDNCVLAVASLEKKRQYVLTLCDTIGSPVDSKVITIEPRIVSMTQYHVIVVSDAEVYIWQYRTLVSKLTSITPEMDDSNTALRAFDARERMFHIEDMPRVPPSDVTGFRSRYNPEYPEDNPISAVCASGSVLLIARSGGQLYRFTLPHLSLEGKYNLRCHATHLALNCTSTRCSIIDTQNILSFFDMKAAFMEENTTARGGDSKAHLEFERKDVWSIVWADDDPEMFAVTEKARLTVFKGFEPENPIPFSGYLCQYSNLEVRSILLDELIVSPEQPVESMIVDHHNRTLSTAKELLDVGLVEAYDYIEENPHKRLWKLLAEASLEALDFSMAERSFVKSKEYHGIKYVKRLSQIQDRSIQKAEVAAYFTQYDQAENIYRDLDRKNLAIELRIRLGDWFRVLQLLQSGGGNDTLMTRAWNQIGAHYADRQQWLKASQYYKQAKNSEALAGCYYTLGDFEKLRALADTLPEGSSLLTDIAHQFQRVGLAEFSADIHLRNGNAKAAIDVCVLLNSWEKAVQLAEEHKFPQIDGVLTKYATQLMESGNIVQAIELYRSANKSTLAAGLLAKLAQERKQEPLQAKKINVLAALEVDRFRNRVLDLTTMGGGMTAAQTTAATLDTLMQHDAATGENKTLDNPWRGAEAYHYFLLAHRQLYAGNTDRALRTAFKVAEYEDILDMKEVYSLIALTAYYAGHHEKCSIAFMKLESLECCTESEREAYSDLSMDLFSKIEPVDPEPSSKSRSNSCPVCHIGISVDSSSCSKCRRTFQSCVKTGALIIDQRTYFCKQCRHQSIEVELRSCQCCPLCHVSLT